jgi:hypothetical protein
MSPAGPVNKGRIAGVALLGLAAAALVVGIVMAVSGGPASNTAAGPSPSATPTGSRGSGAPGTSQAPSGTRGAPGRGVAPGSGSATAPAGPGSGTRAPKPPGGATTTVVPAPTNAGAGHAGPGNGNAARGGGGNARAVRPVAEYNKTPIRVYNNSKIHDLARRGAAEFRADGYHVVEVGNYSDGIIPTTTMYYRPGTREKATAEALAKEFHARAKPRFPGIRDASPGVIIILTKDFSGAQKK